METVTKEQAEAAIALVKRYLAQEQAAWVAAGSPETPRPGTGGADPDHWYTAKQWAKLILDASERDGWYGCPYCRS